MAGEQDTMLGIESDDTTRAFLEKKKRSEPSRVRQLLQSKGAPEPGASIGAANIDSMMGGPNIRVQGPAAPGADKQPAAGGEGGAAVKDPQRPEAQAAEQIQQGAKAGDREVGLDVGLGVIGGARDAAQEVLDGIQSLDAWFLENSVEVSNRIMPGSGEILKLTGADKAGQKAAADMRQYAIRLPDVPQPETLAGGLTRGITQFVAGFIPATRAVKAAGLAGKAAGAAKAVGMAEAAAGAAGAAAEAATASAITNFAAFDPHAERLSNFLTQYPILKNPVTRYLAADPGDTELEGRFKNVIEGLGVDAALSGAFTASLKALRGAKRAVQTELKGMQAVDASTVEKGVEIKIEGPSGPDPKAAPKPEAPAADLFGETGKLVAEAKSSGAIGAASIPPAGEEAAQGFLNIQLAGETGEKALNVNLGKIDSPDDVKKVLAKTVETFGDELRAATRSRQSNELTAQLADELGMTPDDLLARRRGEAFNAEEALAARRLLVSSAENLRKLAEKVQSVEATDVDRLVFRRAVAVHAAIQKQVSGLTAEAGRALQSFKIMAKSQKEQVLAIKNLLESSGGRGAADDLAQAILDSTDAKGISRVAREAYQANGWDMLFEAWLNARLSGPRTHVVNTVSNAINLLLQFPEKATASLIGKVLRSQDAVQPAEVLADAYGFLQGIDDGWRLAREAFRTEGANDPLTKLPTLDRRAITAENLSRTFLGRRVIDPALKTLNQKTLLEHGPVAHFVDGLGSAVRFTGFRLLNSEDAFFKAVNYRMAIHSSAFREAIQEGLTGKALAMRIVDLIENPSESMRVTAQEIANVNTFTNTNKLAVNIAQFTRNVPGLRYIIPFVNTPVNIVKFGLDRTPFALMSSKIRGDIMAGGARRDLAMARIALGSAAMMTAWSLAARGRITGGAPADPALKKVWQAENQEYSLVFYDKNGKKTFVSYNRLEPMGMLFGIAADYEHIAGALSESEASEVVAAGIVALMKNVASKTWMKGAADLFEALSEPDRKLGTFVQNIAGGFFPNLVDQTNNSLIDPVLRETRGFREGSFLARSLAEYMDTIKEKVPGYSRTMPAQRNIWGEPIEPRAGFNTSLGQRAFNLLSPMYVRSNDRDKVNETILANEIEVEMPRRTITMPGVEEAIELTPAEYSRFVELAGKPAKKALDEIVAQPDWERRSQYEKQEVVRSVVSSFRQRAKGMLIEEFPDLKRRIMDKQEEFRASQQAAG